MSKTKSTIVIVDDHPVVLEGLVKMLSKKEEFTISGAFANGQALLDFLQQEAVDIILLDIALPDFNGLDLCQQIKAIAPGTIVLAFSNYNERSAVMKMIDNGAAGYILKSATPQEIIGCIRNALEGGLAFSDEVGQIVSSYSAGNQTLQTVSLGAREKEILKMIASGITTPQIAKTLFLSRFTIENHRKNMLQKLQVKNVAELIAEAAKRGLI